MIRGPNFVSTNVRRRSALVIPGNLTILRAPSHMRSRLELIRSTHADTSTSTRARNRTSTGGTLVLSTVQIFEGVDSTTGCNAVGSSNCRGVRC